MNKIATILLGLTALVTMGIGVERIVFWLSPPAGSGISPGPLFGVILVGAGVLVAAGARAVWRDQRGGWIVAAVAGAALIAVAYIVWNTPGPPPLPLPLTGGMAAIGLALIGLVVARGAGRAVP